MNELIVSSITIDYIKEYIIECDKNKYEELLRKASSISDEKHAKLFEQEIQPFVKEHLTDYSLIDMDELLEFDQDLITDPDDLPIEDIEFDDDLIEDAEENIAEEDIEEEDEE